MRIKLSIDEVCKILASLSTEDIKDRLDYNWSKWDVTNDIVAEDCFTLTTKKEDKK